jgi:hypothetical protein
MQTFQIQVEDNIVDKILWFLENLKENIKIKKISNTQSNLEKSLSDLENNRISPIENIDRHIEDLKNAIK